MSGSNGKAEMQPLHIYLAGKISKNGWRNEIVKGLGLSVYGTGICPSSGEPTDLSEDWPILGWSIFDNHHYVGPFFISDDHGCYHGDNSHGTIGYTDRENIIEMEGPSYSQFMNGEYTAIGYDFEPKLPSSDLRQFVLYKCRNAIRNSDMLFAWIDSYDAYGTFAEIGFAHGTIIPTYIACPPNFNMDDLWFIFQMSYCKGTLVKVFETPREALERAIALEHSRRDAIAKYKTVESPIERQFLAAWDKKLNGLEMIIPQFQIGQYRADFAIPSYRLAIELDGHDYHKTKEQRTNDAKRQRDLEIMGWRVIRFTGTEVYRNATLCISETLRILTTLGGES